MNCASGDELVTVSPVLESTSFTTAEAAEQSVPLDCCCMAAIVAQASMARCSFSCGTSPDGSKFDAIVPWKMSASCGIVAMAWRSLFRGTAVMSTPS